MISRSVNLKHFDGSSMDPPTEPAAETIDGDVLVATVPSAEPLPPSPFRLYNNNPNYSSNYNKSLESSATTENNNNSVPKNSAHNYSKSICVDDDLLNINSSSPNNNEALDSSMSSVDLSIISEHASVTAASIRPDHHARRPMNAFLIFCKRHRTIVREKYPNLENR